MFLLHAAAASSASVKPDRLDIVGKQQHSTQQRSTQYSSSRSSRPESKPTPPTEGNEFDRNRTWAKREFIFDETCTERYRLQTQPYVVWVLWPQGPVPLLTGAARFSRPRFSTFKRVFKFSRISRRSTCEIPKLNPTRHFSHTALYMHYIPVKSTNKEGMHLCCSTCAAA